MESRGSSFAPSILGSMKPWDSGRQARWGRRQWQDCKRGIQEAVNQPGNLFHGCEVRTRPDVGFGASGAEGGVMANISHAHVVRGLALPHDRRGSPRYWRWLRRREEEAYGNHLAGVVEAGWCSNPEAQEGLPTDSRSGAVCDVEGILMVVGCKEMKMVQT